MHSVPSLIRPDLLGTSSLVLMQVLVSLNSGDVERSAAPEGWLFEAEGADTDLPADIEALLEQQAQQQVESNPDIEQQETPEGEDLLTYGQEYTPDQLEGLPKVGLLSIVPFPGLVVSMRVASHWQYAGECASSAVPLPCHPCMEWPSLQRSKKASTGKTHVVMMPLSLRRRSCRAG